eukprot:XP_011665293.1 PREDICTED: trafficking protein particle complex subunit 13 [Strongylocentrotus purpuratus]
MDVVREKEQLLSIKVMRLTKPSFVSNIPILCESRDLPGNVSSECKPADFYSSRGAVSGLPGFTMGEILTLPQNFGSIYLGETFSCFVSVHNDSLQNSQDIHVKTDLQTSSQRLERREETAERNVPSHPRVFQTRSSLTGCCDTPMMRDGRSAPPEFGLEDSRGTAWCVHWIQAPGYGDLKLSIAQIPDSVPLEKPFQLTCRVTSCCERTMDLKLILNNTTGVVWLGISGKQLGKLGPNTSMDIKLQLIPTIPGLQSISGMRLIDLYLKRTYEHDDIAQVFVYTEQDGPVKNI